ncbi:protein turtle homolog B [Melanotaenia boesemani]|uniref:protein turtle homolog B n=1 Tax=Melanotaenia boesemani TaxID=1250792 RepID=UPI001C05D15D|nr:protein turtle homolog B [Melanotaenia boesemani]
MELHAGFFVLTRRLCSRMQVCIYTCLLPLMTSILWLFILSSQSVASQLGLEDVFFNPQDQTVKEGQAVFFQCVSGESSPPASITWLKDGRVVTRGRQFQGEYGGGQQKKMSGTLHLSNVTLEDDGIYICVTRNYLLNTIKKSKPAKLTVQGVPMKLQITQGPENITVAMETKVSMQCTVRGFPVPMVHWFKDGCLLLNCSGSFSVQNNGQLLTFRNVSKEDEGWYHCEASNIKETIKSQPAFLLPAEMDWSFAQQPTDLMVKRGENVSVTCRAPHSRPEAQVSWFKNNQLLTPSPHITVLPSGDLFFHSIQEHDSGSYFCRASNIHLQRFITSKRATLSVLAPPSVKLWPTVLTVPLGARAVLQCEVSGHPLPSISWVKRGHSKQTGGKVSYGQRNATLQIQSARSYDEAVYVCEASNALGKTHNTALLRVAVSPIIITYIGQMSCKIRASVVLPCGAVGILPITYSWSRTRAGMQTPISSTEEKHVDEDGALHISTVEYSDAGEYYCTAENRAGRHQRSTVLIVTAEDHPADRSEQTSEVLSASTNVSNARPVSQLGASMSEQKLKTTHCPHEQAQHKGSSSNNAPTSPTFILKKSVLKTASRTPSVLQHQINQQTTNPTQLLVTQMQPPILPPPPHPNFQSVDLYTQRPMTKEPLFISKTQPVVTLSPTSVVTRDAVHITLEYLLTESKTSTLLGEQFQHQVSEKLFLESKERQITEMIKIQPPSKLPVGPFGFLKLDSYTPIPTPSPVKQIKMRQAGLVNFTATSPTESYLSKSYFHQLVTNRPFSHREPSLKISHTKKTDFQSSLSQTSLPHQPFTLRFLPKFHLELSTTYLSSEPPLSLVSKLQPSQVHSQLSATTTSKDGPSPQLSSSTILPLDHGASVLDPTALHPVNRSGQVNATQAGIPLNNTKFTDWLKRNTSQSPMTSSDPKLTQESRSWLPVLEKHDIPIVVGVGVSLAFIFITVTFYSVVQKNEPAPTSRAAQRNLGVPIRHAERRTAGRTNRAFEDDDCVAVIEQSPNTSDTRARPPGPSLVTVEMEPAFEDLQDVMLDNHSVTVETYPEPIVDTKIDPYLKEEKSSSVSQPSIQLQCGEDWTSNLGDNQSPCQDALPPPSFLPSPSPSPSPLPPSRREETLRSSLTLQSTEPRIAPIHHSLSISHGNPPLLLSHHISLGLTTVAVDVQVFPEVSTSIAIDTSTHINSVSNSTAVTAPLFSPSLVNSQDSDGQSTARIHHSK